MELPEAVRAEIAKLEENIKTVRALAPVVRTVQGVLDKLGWKSYGDSCDVYSKCAAPYVSVFLAVKDYDGIRTFRNALQAEGLHAHREVDQPSTGTRVAHFDGPIVVYFGFSGGSCSYVQVGEKTEPVYELHCDGAPV